MYFRFRREMPPSEFRKLLFFNFFFPALFTHTVLSQIHCDRDHFWSYARQPVRTLNRVFTPGTTYSPGSFVRSCNRGGKHRRGSHWKTSWTNYAHGLNTSGTLESTGLQTVPSLCQVSPFTDTTECRTQASPEVGVWASWLILWGPRMSAF